MSNKIKLITFATWEFVLIFIVCIALYTANGVTISSGDTIPNTLLAFNLLENHTLHLDAFRNSYFVEMGTFYSFLEGNNGHLSSTYPIGPAIVTFPLYIIFYAYLKLIFYYSSVPLDITSVSFEVYRIFFEKLAASITTAISVVLFYLCSGIKFNRVISLISTFIFAFATNTWMTSSQGLWQHGISNLILIITIFCLLKVNRTSQKNQIIWLVLAGVACGLLPGIRPTSTLFSIAAIVYSIFTYRYRSVFLLIGLVSALPSIGWNLYYFGNLTGGYSKIFTSSPYLFTLNNFIEASLGTLISPSRGLLVFSPIVLYCLPGAYKLFKLRSGKDEKLIGCMTIASIVLLTSYCFYIVWWAGHSYGPRFTTDIMPIVCYLLNYYCVDDIIKLSKYRKKNRNYPFFIFIAVIVYSIFTQCVGAFGAKPGYMWNGIPLNVDIPQHQSRLWELRDNQIQRNAQAIFHKIIKPPTDQQVYMQNLSGVIKKITDGKNLRLDSPILVKNTSTKLIKANLENTGVSKWFGYESALEKGEVRVRSLLYNNSNQLVKGERLYVSGTPKQNELTNAIGYISFPEEPGTYKLIFDLIAEGIGEFPNRIKNNDLEQPYTFTVVVEDNRQFSQEIQILKPLKSSKIGETIEIPIMVKNTSNFVWNNIGTNPVNFSYRWIDANNGKFIVFDGKRTPLPGNLPVQRSIKLNANIQSPDKPGKYILVLTMVKEGVAWFNDKNADALEIPVKVTGN